MKITSTIPKMQLIKSFSYGHQMVKDMVDYQMDPFVLFHHGCFKYNLQHEKMPFAQATHMCFS
jgi:hypothetical protein